ncbi:hypothetical protein [Paenibacillus sp. AN1007]|uniref:Uncharacterized protein n=2 Tax=unclassified Paenibacillus TaxID=185978 RepID=A0AAU8NGR2_9BACL
MLDDEVPHMFTHLSRQHHRMEKGLSLNFTPETEGEHAGLTARLNTSASPGSAWGCTPPSSVQRTPALLTMKESIIPIPKEMPYESTTTTTTTTT